ncbi:ATP-binding protein [Anaerorhabdus sp.]|uniref:ATP-binding protein n=2 Tax=Anaerorhabdus sp. TaxID=1872524 RepID=UPI002FC90BFB
MKNYKKRVVDKELKINMEVFGATLIVGPKWGGKTTTGLNIAKSVLRLQDPDNREEYLKTASIKPSVLLKGDTPRLIDEWQDAPVLWDAVRLEVDQRQEMGQFILTGSTTINKENIMHSGVGRIAKVKMYPMSLYESSESNGTISISDLFETESLDIDGIESQLTIENLIFAACRGGWPSSLDIDDNRALKIAREYINNICDIDISTVDGVNRNPQLAKQIIRSYARNISTLAKKTVILRDITQNTESITIKTLESYLTALNNLYVIEDVPAWSPSIRSASAIRSGNKREFTDPSIAVAAMGLTPEQLMLNLNTFGFIFECLCIRDLRVYTQKLGGRLSYYHDRYNLEADAVVHLDNGKYALIEFKLGSKEIEMGANQLIELKELIIENNEKNSEKMKVPDLLIVITGGKIAYRLDNGVLVIPIGCLKD